jgi:DNA-binding NtrC family response regulator
MLSAICIQQDLTERAMGLSREVPTRAMMHQMLDECLPGSSPAIQRTRAQILDFACSITSQTVLVRGPIGAGKSTVARFVGLFKRVAPLTEIEAQRILEDVKFDAHNRLALRSMPWYVELTLTGLGENIAEAQLFGSLKGAYTGAVDRSGVFEQAMRGRSAKGREPSASLLTGGVVFLDEIGDLSLVLQAKLLPVLSGAPFYRLGGEGHANNELEFRGVTIAASWRSLQGPVLRPDLLSRISGYVIDVPGMEQREEDFDQILTEIQTNVEAAIGAAVDNAVKVEPLADRVYWRELAESIRSISPDARRQLRRVDWSSHGNLRGLTAAVEQIVAAGRIPEQVIEELPHLENSLEHDTLAKRPNLLASLVANASAADGLAGNLRRLEVDQRVAIRQQLLADTPSRRLLAERLGIDDARLLAQVHQLDRRRKRTKGKEA